MKAKTYLEEIGKLDCMIANKRKQIARCEDIAYNTTAHSEGERVQSSSSLQKMADAVDRSVDLKAEIKRCYAKKNEIIAVIEQLNPKEYKLIYKMYAEFPGMRIKEAAHLCKMPYGSAKNIHAQALKNVQRILDKRGKENE